MVTLASFNGKPLPLMLSYDSLCPTRVIASAAISVTDLAFNRCPTVLPRPDQVERDHSHCAPADRPDVKFVVVGELYKSTRIHKVFLM